MTRSKGGSTLDILKDMDNVENITQQSSFQKTRTMNITTWGIKIAKAQNWSKNDKN